MSNMQMSILKRGVDWTGVPWHRQAAPRTGVHRPFEEAEEAWFQFALIQIQ